MLVVTRRCNQSVRIGDNIEIILVEVRGDQVRIGIEAPPDVKIVRDELDYFEKHGK